jgi:4-amino-4-deoxy-L-arabinose transferase-like glycosyltransferase
MNAVSDRPWFRPFVLALLALALWGGEYARRGLWEPDEARYAYVAREMRNDGHWLVPHRHGQPYAHKPPLMFWLMNAAALTTGGEVNGVSARLPSLLGAVLSFWSLFDLGRRWLDARAAWRAVFVLATSYLFWRQGGWAQIDMLLCGLEMTAFALLFRNADDGVNVRRSAVAFSCMGLAVLAKGPVGFLVPAGSYVAACLLAGERDRIRRQPWLAGTAIALLWPFAWLVCVWAGGAPAGYLRELLFRQNAERAAGYLGHGQPFYYFLVQAPVDFLPWALFLPAAAAAALRASRGADPALWTLFRRCLGWVLFVVVFFGLSASKRGLYVLFAHPAAALAVAAALPGVAALRRTWILPGALVLLALAAGTLVAGLGLLLYPQAPIPAWTLWPSMAVMAVGAWHLTRVFLNEGGSTRWFARLAAVLAVNQACIGAFLLPALNPVKAPVAFGAMVQARLPPSRPLLLYKINGEILTLYGQRRGRTVWDPESLRSAMKEQGSGIVVSEEEQWQEPESRLGPGGNVGAFRMGGKRFVWLEFDEERGAGPGRDDAPPNAERSVSGEDVVDGGGQSGQVR